MYGTRIRVLLLGLVLLFPGVADLAAQERAILVRGPTHREGIECLPPNRMAAVSGEYAWGDAVVRVYFTAETVALSRTWSAARCPTAAFSTFTGDGILFSGDAYWYASGAAWSIFAVFPAGAPANVCAFLDVFISRFLFFYTLPGNRIVQFPAILNIR